MGTGRELDLLAVWEWADRRGFSRKDAADICFGLLHEYHEIMAELYPPPER